MYKYILKCEAQIANFEIIDGEISADISIAIRCPAPLDYITLDVLVSDE